MLFTESQSRGITRNVMGFVKADDAVITVNSGTRSHLRFAANSFQTSGNADNLGVTVRVWIGRKRGEAFTNDVSDQALKAAVVQAEAVARLAPIDVEYVPSLGLQVYKATSPFSEATANVPLGERARQINEAIVASENAGVVRGISSDRADGAGGRDKERQLQLPADVAHQPRDDGEDAGRHELGLFPEKSF
jgi:hypothetical protein